MNTFASRAYVLLFDKLLVWRARATVTLTGYDITVTDE